MIGARRVTRLLGTAALACAAACGGSAAPQSAAGSGIPAERSSGANYVETGAAATYRAHCDAPTLIAHRGETGDDRNLPENTWQAEVAAATEGATYLNMDVRWTSDGVPVALHDATVNRTTSETRPKTPITDLTAQQYVALDARGYATDTTAGRIVPSVHPDTLAEALAKIAPTGKPIVLQMEADPYRAAEAGRAGVTPRQDFAKLAQVIRSSGYASRVTVAGWSLADLRAFHAVAPNVALAYLFETIGTKSFPTAQQLLAAGAHILYVDFRGVTAPGVASWHAAALKVWAWTPADRVQWQRLRTDGVDAIATNWATFYLRWAPVPCSADSSE
ncbi:glycerophosphodiester phosphodiesterase [Actinospica sp.]|uniref:glycerophosphodiester phosphodiesterase n=1 Tax=Actinospica sp. TaxID=1872142 RepID=UPI002BA68E1D|nr:glycerophosphodiester phosphodiesterase family protein [Actinospica sp.]HWG27887.1 glycerophosphodiester phosphodiesterase family protein [Actinospica sp.]